MNWFDSPALRAWILVVAGAFFAPGTLFASDHDVRILLDLDNDAATGCTVATTAGPFDGVEQILITTVETTSPPPAGTVTDVATSNCINPATDTFGPPASFDGVWPVGIDNGEGGLDVVETYFPLLSSVVPDPQIIRLAVVVTDELGGEQTLLTVNGTLGGQPILLALPGPLDIPSLSEWGLILLALLLTAVSIFVLGRQGAVAAVLVFVLFGAGLPWAAPGPDGLINEWLHQHRIAGNSMVLWAKKLNNQLHFRVDLELRFNTAPTADPQAVTTDEDTSVAITLTGSDPQSDPLIFTIVPGSGPNNGTLTGTPPNVTYDPDPGYAGPDSFDFQVEDPSGATDTATVSITVAPAPVDGLCGSADGKVYLYTDTTYGADTFCNAGSVDPASPAFPAQGGGSNWDCLGVNGGSDDACSASRGTDTTPPVTTVALAEASKSSTTWSGSATIDEAGTGYCTALTTGASAPTAAEVKADTGTGHSGTGGSVAMTANTTATCQVTGLTPGTTYDFYFVAEDASTNLQADGDVSGLVTVTTGSATATTLLALGVAVDTVVDLVAKTDTNSTGYCVAVPEGSAAPTVAQIAAAAGGAIVGTGGSVALTANTGGFCQVTGLTASTAYDFYFVAKDGANVYQGSAGSVLNESTAAALGGAPAGMVAVLGGCFKMGDNLDNNTLGGGDELPVHPVCLTSYYIDAKEVTQLAYNTWGGDGDHAGHATPADDNPANNLDWVNASAFCAAAGKRLPTEAEWEYAARGRDPDPLNPVRYATAGDVIGCGSANYNNCVGTVAAVGSYASNSLGIYDMSGNVWEFVSDYYAAAYYSSSPVTDPENTTAGALVVIRGGSFSNPAAIVRASLRNSAGTVARLGSYGFRCAKD